MAHYRDKDKYYSAECVTEEHDIDIEGLRLSVNAKWEYTYRLNDESDPADRDDVDVISVTVADVYDRDGESLDLPDQVLECIADKLWTMYKHDYIFCELINGSLTRRAYNLQRRPIPSMLTHTAMLTRPLAEVYIAKPRNRREAMELDPDYFMEQAREEADERAADRRKGVAA